VLNIVESFIFVGNYLFFVVVVGHCLKYMDFICIDNTINSTAD